MSPGGVLNTRRTLIARRGQLPCTLRHESTAARSALYALRHLAARQSQRSSNERPWLAFGATLASGQSVRARSDACRMASAPQPGCPLRVAADEPPAASRPL